MYLYITSPRHFLNRAGEQLLRSLKVIESGNRLTFLLLSFRYFLLKVIVSDIDDFEKRRDLEIPLGVTQHHRR